jgi:hypothetical protein
MITLSRHARRRCRQRGINSKRLSALFEHADIDRPVGSNCRLIKVSRAASRFVPSCDGLEKLAAIVSDDTAEIITVLSASATRRGRRYRGGRR